MSIKNNPEYNKLFVPRLHKTEHIQVTWIVKYYFQIICVKNRLSKIYDFMTGFAQGK